MDIHIYIYIYIYMCVYEYCMCVYIALYFELGLYILCVRTPRLSPRTLTCMHARRKSSNLKPQPKCIHSSITSACIFCMHFACILHAQRHACTFACTERKEMLKDAMHAEVGIFIHLCMHTYMHA